MNERDRRVGLNEALFRRVNNAVEEISGARSTVIDELDLVCECGDASCVERITMAIEEYETLRSDPTHFAIKPGHEIVPTEQVIDQKGGYWIVQKRRGGPAELAEELDRQER